MPAGWLFLVAYTCSGLAGLVYEVAWTRLLTLYMGHTTAAASTVVASFMGGLAAGSAIGGRVASRLTRRRALQGYALLEAFVILTALLLPLELAGLTPLLKWAYRDGASGALFPAIRLVTCLIVLSIPAVALGATFPFAVRWFAPDGSRAGRSAGALYAANTLGAALGAIGCGFVLIPALGVSGATLVGVGASAIAIAAALSVAQLSRDDPPPAAPVAGKSSGKKTRTTAARASEPPPRLWLATTVLAVTGFTSLTYEIAWTRVFASLIGPSTYAFAAVLAGFVSGLAAGAAVGAWAAGRVRRAELPLACALAGATIAAAWTSIYAGSGFVHQITREFAQSAQAFSELLIDHSLRVVALVAPAAVALGFAFPFALDIAGRRHPDLAARIGTIYAVNAAASVAGSLAAGFIAIPLIGLQATLQASGAILLASALAVIVFGDLSGRARLVGLVPVVAAAGLIVGSSPWDRELVASGGYKYAARVAPGLDVEAALKAGSLVYYREGASGIVSVKRLTGNLSLAIDGKVDASTTGDMLTQKLLAHLPLLIHGRATTAGIIGLGSGVTLASALLHPLTSVDVVEISPEVVEASQYFAAENRRALDDPRVRLILGDGRTHLALSNRRYDVIVSEPSNPWMAGVAALFTREFFLAARDRLAPDGIICQWAHTYDISDADLRSIVATFASVFPNGTMWLVGGGDLLLIGSGDALDGRLATVSNGWRLPNVAADLEAVELRDPFALWSLYVGGPAELRAYGTTAEIQTDNRLALEFSGPRAVNSNAAAGNLAAIRRLLEGRQLPSTIADARGAATARQWRDRAAMMLAADAYDEAYADYATSVKLDRTDAGALAGLVRAAVAARREQDAAGLLKGLIDSNPGDTRTRIALSKLHAATGAFDDALAAAQEAARMDPTDPEAVIQLASLYADAGDATQLRPMVELLQRRFPGRPETQYYQAAAHFLLGELPAALGFIRQVIAADPKRADAYNMLGAIQASQGQRDDARRAFEAALERDPRGSATYTNLGLLELSSGNRAKAAELFAEALSLDPASAPARQGLAETR